MGTEDQSRRRARRDEPGHELAGHLCGIRRVGQPRLLGQGRVLEPVEQGHAEGADGADLRVVDVRVDEPGQQDTTAKVDDRVVRVCLAHVGEVSAGPDDAVLDPDAGVLR